MSNDTNLLHDNDHTFTLQIGTRNNKGLRNKVLIFSTMSKKHDLDKINDYKANKDNVEVVHNVISSKAMEILKEYIKVSEDTIRDYEGLLAEEYENEE